MEHSHAHEDYTELNKDTRNLLVKTLAATSQEIETYQQHKHFIGTYDIDGIAITENRLMDWATDPLREFYCVFCGKPPIKGLCRICNDYKGIMPNCNP